MTAKTLLIGGAGFLGNSLAKHLTDRGISVTVLDSRSRLERYATPLQNVEYMPGDWPSTSEYRNLAAFDTVVHLAWSTHPATSMANIYEDASVNILGTLRLLDSIPVGGIEKFIFMSSGGTVYGNDHGSVLSETCEPRPVSAYGISKLTCEKYVGLYALRKHFRPVNIRLGNPYGSYQLQGTPVGVVANFINKIFSGDALEIYGNGEIVRDYVYIDDFTSAMEKIITCTEIAGTFNLGSGVGISLSEIMQIIQNATKKSFDVNYLESRRSDVRSVVLNSDKLRRAIGHSGQTSIEQGINFVVKSYVNTCKKTA